MNKTTKFAFGLLLVGLAAGAAAQVTTPDPAMEALQIKSITEAVDAPLNALKAFSGSWATYFTAAGKLIFGFLTMLMLSMWALEQLGAGKTDTESLTRGLLTKLVIAGLTYAFLFYDGWSLPEAGLAGNFSTASGEGTLIQWLVANFAALAAQAGAATGSTIPAGMSSPTGMIAAGWALVKAYWTGTSKLTDQMSEANDGWFDALSGATLDLAMTQTAIWILVVVACVVIMFAFILMAATLFMTLVEAMFVIAVGSLFLAGFGSPFTKDYGSKSIGYAVQVGVKLMAMTLLIAFAVALQVKGADIQTAFLTNMQGIAADATIDELDALTDGLLLAYFAITVSYGLLILIVFQFNPLVSAIVSGAAVLTGAMLAKGLATAASVSAGAATAGTALGGAVAGGALKASVGGAAGGLGAAVGGARAMVNSSVGDYPAAIKSAWGSAKSALSGGKPDDDGPGGPPGGGGGGTPPARRGGPDQGGEPAASAGNSTPPGSGSGQGGGNAGRGGSDPFSGSYSSVNRGADASTGWSSVTSDDGQSKGMARVAGGVPQSISMTRGDDGSYTAQLSSGGRSGGAFRADSMEGAFAAATSAANDRVPRGPSGGQGAAPGGGRGSSGAGREEGGESPSAQRVKFKSGGAKDGGSEDGQEAKKPGAFRASLNAVKTSLELGRQVSEAGSRASRKLNDWNF